MLESPKSVSPAVLDKTIKKDNFQKLKALFILSGDLYLIIFFARNFAGTAHSAYHSSNNGLGNSLCSLCAGVGCTIQGGSSVGKYQQEI